MLCILVYNDIRHHGDSWMAVFMKRFFLSSSQTYRRRIAFRTPNFHFHFVTMGGTRQMWKVRLMVCLAVLNRLKIRMKNMDSEVFLFSSSKEIKTDRKKIYCSPYTSCKCWRWTLRSYLLLLISFFPWFFPCCCRFFCSLPIFSFFLSFFFYFMDFSLLFRRSFFCLGF